MKQINILKKITEMTSYLIIVSICTSCSYDDYMLTDNYLMDNTFQSYIGLTDIKNGPKTKLEIEMFNEAAERFSSRIIIEKDNTVKLIEGTNAYYLNISPELFFLFNEVLNSWNDNPVTLIRTKDKKMIRTKGGDPEPQETRGGTLIRDMAASEVYFITYACGWTLTAKLFHMWYYDNRCSDYTLTNDEWSPIEFYSNEKIGDDYKHNSFLYGGVRYYSKGISFYDASNDLKYAIGDGNISVDEDGNAVGMKDYYNFDESNRRAVNEAIVSVLRWVGDDMGYVIKHGVYNLN